MKSPASHDALAERHLVALIPPGSVEAEIGAVQNALFADYGLASALALPPLLPLGFVAEADAAGLLAAVCGRPAGRYVFRGRGLRWRDGGLFLDMDTGGVWKTLRELAGESGGPFPVAEGFVLGCWDAQDEMREAVRAVVPPVKFTSCSAAVVVLRGAWGEADWWRELYVEIESRRPFR